MATNDDDVRAVRALAHPLRLELLDLLSFEGPSTATRLAHRVGESSGATSYHLRLLAKYGYIEEIPREHGRERWWAYRERRISVPNQAAHTTRELLAELLSRQAHALDRYLASAPRPADWDAAAFFRSHGFRLTAGELEDLRLGIEALLAPLRPADANDAPADALPVRVVAFGFPQIMEGSGERER
jgi:DNA-binding transcriptional ArsR family regulator